MLLKSMSYFSDKYFISLLTFFSVNAYIVKPTAVPAIPAHVFICTATTHPNSVTMLTIRLFLRSSTFLATSSTIHLYLLVSFSFCSFVVSSVVSSCVFSSSFIPPNILVVLRL